MTRAGLTTKSDQTCWKEFIRPGLILVCTEGESNGVVLHGGEQEAGHNFCDVPMVPLTGLLGCLGLVEVVDNVILRIGPLNH